MITRYFGIPQYLIDSGLFKQLKPGHLKLYMFLMFKSERNSTRLLLCTDSAIRQGANVAPRTSCNARKKLQEYGLIKYRKTTGNKYVYEICDATTGIPFPGNPRARVIYKRVERGAKHDTKQNNAASHGPLVVFD